MGKPKIEVQWMGVNQVSQYIGGNIGVKTIRELMQSGEIRSVYVGSKLVTRLQDVREWENAVFTSKQPVKIGEKRCIVPTEYLRTK